MESKAEQVFCIIASLTFFTPLTWIWMRNGLWLVNRWRENNLAYPTMWLRLLHVVPALTISLLFAMWLVALSCLITREQSLWRSLLKNPYEATLITMLFIMPIGVAAFIWKGIYDEMG